MPVLNLSHLLRSVLAGALLCGVLNAPALADTLHLHNGKVIHGKLYRVSGELIEFKGPAQSDVVQRIHLTNRRDVVETHSRKYFGEIIYVDKFKVEIATASGRMKINRLKIKNIVMGSPAERPVHDYLESMQQQYQPTQGSMPANPDRMMMNGPGMTGSDMMADPAHPVVSFPQNP